ncbi:hypothetical protein Droror1_Dr00017876 [Drosera rotundifolia]
MGVQGRKEGKIGETREEIGWGKSERGDASSALTTVSGSKALSGRCRVRCWLGWHLRAWGYCRRGRTAANCGRAKVEGGGRRQVPCGLLKVRVWTRGLSGWPNLGSPRLGTARSMVVDDARWSTVAQGVEAMVQSRVEGSSSEPHRGCGGTGGTSWWAEDAW